MENKNPFGNGFMFCVFFYIFMVVNPTIAIYGAIFVIGWILLSLFNSFFD